MYLEKTEYGNAFIPTLRGYGFPARIMTNCSAVCPSDVVFLDDVSMYHCENTKKNLEEVVMVFSGVVFGK